MLTACAADAPEATPGTGFGAAGVSYLDGSLAVAPAFTAVPREATAGGQAEPEVEAGQLERELRAELAVADDPAPAALELAALFCELERHQEAAAVLAAAIRRSAEPSLRIALASVQRDLGQRHLAAAGLAALHREQGTLALHPALLFELAELQWLEGEKELAKATLVELQSAHTGHPWCAQNAGALRSLELELTSLATPSRVRLRDLLGNLRGAPVELVRLRTLEELVRMAGNNGEAGATPAALQTLRERAIAIGCGDDSSIVRARAIQLAVPAPAAQPEFCRTALADGSALVRRHAAMRAVELLGERAVPLLLASLEPECDGPTFFAIHEALSSLTADPPAVDRADLGNEAGRATVVQAWQQHRIAMAATAAVAR